MPPIHPLKIDNGDMQECPECHGVEFVKFGKDNVACGCCNGLGVVPVASWIDNEKER